MRRTVSGFATVLLASICAGAGAQTPTSGPSPTPTPVARQYVSDPAVVNTETTNNQRRPAVAVGNDGEYLIVWNSDTGQSGFYDIKGQLYSADGVEIGSEFQIDQAGANHSNYTPDVAADGQGNYVVVWADFDGNPSTNAEVWMRQYDEDANPLGPATQVNTFTTGRQRLPQVAAAPSGKFVVTWGSEGQDGNGLGVFAVEFSATAVPAGGEFAVNTVTTGDQDRPVVDMDEGGFTIAFNDGTGAVSAREFGTSGPVGPQFPVLGTGHQLPDVARLDGTANTLFVAENINTGSIDAVRSEDGTVQSPFVIVPSTGRALIGSRLATFTKAEPPAAVHNPEGTPLPSGAWITWEEYDATVAEYVTLCQELDIDPGLAEVGPPLPLFPANATRGVTRIASGEGGQLVGTRAAAARDGSGDAIEMARAGMPEPLELEKVGSADPVVEPDEDANIAALIFNPAVFVTLIASGSLSSSELTGPAGSGLTIIDGNADYGTVDPLETASCQDTGDCYRISVQGPRPGPHWDEFATETLSTGVHKTWRIHIGSSFADVPNTNPFYAFIENLLHNGITGGGACGGYCPTDGVKRQQMAVFLLKARFGAAFTPPPATGTVFSDVPLSNPFASWIEALYLLGVTGGCSGGPPPAPIQFCPDGIVNRQQMAVFLLKTLEGAAYVPPAATDIFDDVDDTNPFRTWIEELYNRGVTGGCATMPLRYCPGNPTNRQQMAAFLVNTFGLQLYGP